MTSFPSCKTEVVLGRLGGLVTLESTKKNFAYVIVQGEPLVSVLLSYCCNNATQQTPTPPILSGLQPQTFLFCGSVDLLWFG